MSIGAFSGLNISTVKLETSNGTSADPITNAFIGINTTYEFRKTALSIDFLYAKRGYRDNSSDLVFKYRFPYIDIAPQIGYKMAENWTLSSGVYYAFFKEQPSDFGLNLKLKGTYKNVYSFIRYNHGLKDFNDPSDFVYTVLNDSFIGIIENDRKIFNRSIQIGAGFKFKL